MVITAMIEGVSKSDDDKMILMKSIKENCMEAGVEVPNGVDSYLDDPNHGIVCKLRPGIEHGVTKTLIRGIEVIEIELSQIDTEIDVIRITKSW